MVATLRTRSRRRPAFTLVEVVFCTLLVAIVLVGATEMLGSTVRGRRSNANVARAQLLAQELMTEILNTNYHEMDIGGLLGGLLQALLNTLGLDSGESANRMTFDDTDDFHGWNESPPQTRNGAALPNSTGWRRTVTVEFVNPANPTQVLSENQGLKRVTVAVSYNGQTLTRLVALRSDKYTP